MDQLIKFSLFVSLFFFSLSSILAEKLAENLLQAFNDLKVDSSKTLIDNNFQIKQKFLSLTKSNFVLCYDSSISAAQNVSANIFTENLLEISQKYFDVHSYYLKSTDRNSTSKRVQMFLNGLTKLAELIIDCQNKPKNEQFLLGLTSRTAIASDETSVIASVQPNGQLKGPLKKLKSDKCDLEKIFNVTSLYELIDKKRPQYVDWREKNVITKVKNQGHCGDCYIFSVIGPVESAFAIKNKQLVSLSEQYLLSCGNNNGCNATEVKNTDEDLIYEGTVTEEKLPYNGDPDKSKCKKDPTALDWRIDDYCEVLKESLPGDDDEKKNELMEAMMMEYLSTRGPITVMISTGNMFANFKGKFYTGVCSYNIIDHAVYIVGYDGDAAPSWLIKNSWGEDWANKGYVLFPRKINQCLVNEYFNFPILP